MDEPYTEPDRLHDPRREVALFEDFRAGLVRTRSLAKPTQPPEGPMHPVVTEYSGFKPFRISHARVKSDRPEAPP